MNEFQTEYDRVNPITQREAIAEALEAYIANAEKSDNVDMVALQAMKKQLMNNLQGKGMLGMVNQYAATNSSL